MKVLVAGGTGFIGTHLCRELADRGHDVTALARNPDDAELPDPVEAVVGDVTAIDSLSGAVAGQDAVVNLVSLSPLFKPRGGEQMHNEIHLKGTRNLVDAATAAGVERFLQMSGLGVDPDGPTAYLRAKGRAEEVVRGSSLGWTIVRPSVVFGDNSEFVSFTRTIAPPYLTPLPGGGETRFQPIYVGNLVSMLADALESETHAEETYELGGPETLTLAEIARLLHRAGGRPVTVIPIPMALVKIGLMVLDSVPGAPMGRDQYRSLQLDNTTADNDIDAFGLTAADLTTMREYLDLPT